MTSSRKIASTLYAVGASKMLTLDRATLADAAQVYFRENGEERFRVGMSCGENDFSIQYSPDGTPFSYDDRLRIDSETGEVTVKGLNLDGARFANPRLTGQARFADGSASAPAIAREGDTNTGFFFPGGDVVAGGAGGEEVFRFSPLGFAIGGNVSSAYKLVVGGHVLAGDGEDHTPDGSWTGQVTINGNGFKAGLAADGAGLWVGTNSASRDVIMAVNETEVARFTPTGLAVGGSSANYPVDVHGDIRAREAFKVGTGAGTAYGNDNLIRPASPSAFLNIKGGAGRAKVLLGNDDVNISGGTGSVVFRYGAGASDGGVEAMRVDSSGRVGIGTSSPDHDFDVKGTFGVSGAATLGGNIAFLSDDARLYPTSSDGTDSARVALLGGGGFTSSRGAYMYVCGNEHASTPGRAIMVAGEGAGADVSGTRISLIASDNTVFYNGGTEAARIASGGQFLIGATSGASKLVVNDDSVQVTSPKTPASATDTGETGQIAWDDEHIYVCTAPDTWKRSALTTW